MIRKMIRKVGIVTKDEVQTIFAAKRRVKHLSTEWYKAVRNGEVRKALKIRRESNQIKQEILAKYEIIL